MINKIIAEYLRTNKRLVVPHFGAFIRKENSEAIVFVPFLKKDDGVIVEKKGGQHPPCKAPRKKKDRRPVYR